MRKAELEFTSYTALTHTLRTHSASPTTEYRNGTHA